MSNDTSSSKTLARLAGIAVGVVFFLGVNFFMSRPMMPSVEDVAKATQYPTTESPTEVAARDATGESAVATGPTDPGAQVYGNVCAACHQATGLGLPGAFPPLAKSEWLISDPETPIRIVLAGLSGEIEVAGAKYTSMMPPPPGLTDQQIADALTYARKSFGNSAGPVDVALVAAVRATVQGRAPWTAVELQALRPSAAPAPEAAPTPAATPK